MIKNRLISYGMIILLVISSLTGCSLKREKLYEINGFAFNTTYKISLYENGSQKLLNECVKKCSEYEQIFSRTQETSELYQINQISKCYRDIMQKYYPDEMTKLMSGKQKKYTKKLREELENSIRQKISKKNKIEFQITDYGEIEYKVSQIFSEIVKKGLQYSKESNNVFDIAIEPLTSLWNFTGEKPTVPKHDKIKNALNYVNSKKIQLQKGKLIYRQPGLGIDLGGIAKGFIADELKKYLLDNKVSSAIINLGGNILCIGKKSSNENFSIGVQQPFADRNETIAAVSVHDMSVVSSGIYERFFKTKNGKMYHHILNPKTGYSFENGILGVTILSRNSSDGDALSTTCFALGEKKGMAYINSLKDVEAMFITKGEKKFYSKGFQKYLMK